MEYSELLNQLYQKLEQKKKWLSAKDIRSIRRYFGLTQVKFADLLDVSYGTYKNWEIGHRIPSSPSMALLYIARDWPEIFLKNQTQKNKK